MGPVPAPPRPGSRFRRGDESKNIAAPVVISCLRGKKGRESGGEVEGVAGKVGYVGADGEGGGGAG